MSRKRNRYKPYVPDTKPLVEPKLKWDYSLGKWFATYSGITYCIDSVRVYCRYNQNRFIKQLLIKNGNDWQHITGGQNGGKIRKLAERDLNRRLKIYPMFNKNKSTLVFDSYSNTLRQMPENYLIAHLKESKFKTWVCEPDLAADRKLCMKVFAALLTYENKYQQDGNVLVQTILNS